MRQPASLEVNEKKTNKNAPLYGHYFVNSFLLEGRIKVERAFEADHS